MKKLIMIALAISLCTTSAFAASDSTVFLYHFDGDQKDSSSNNYPAPFGEFYSDSFVEGSDYFGGSALSPLSGYNTIILNEPLTEFTLEGQFSISEYDYETSVKLYVDGVFREAGPFLCESYNDAISLASQYGTVVNEIFNEDDGSYLFFLDVTCDFLNYGGSSSIIKLNDQCAFFGEDGYMYEGVQLGLYYMAGASAAMFVPPVMLADPEAFFLSSTFWPWVSGELFHFALVCDGDTVTYFVNGESSFPSFIFENEYYTFSYPFSGPLESLTFNAGDNTFILDELRLSSKALYNGSYTPPTEPFIIIPPSLSDLSGDFLSSLNDGTLEDAGSILDGSLDNLPDLSQHSDFTSFLSAALAWVPSEYWTIYALCFVLLIVRVVISFLWR